MTDRNNQDPIAIVMQELPDGGRVVMVPDKQGLPASRGVLAVLEADGSVREIMLRLPRALLLDLAKEQASVNMIDREPTAEELDSMMRAMGTSMHDAHDHYAAAFAAELVRRIGGASSPRDAIIDSIRNEIADRIADAREPDPGDREAIEDAVRDITVALDSADDREDAAATVQAVRDAAARIAGRDRDPVRFMLRSFARDLVESGSDPHDVRSMIETLGSEVGTSGLGDRLRASLLDPEADPETVATIVDTLATLAVETARRFKLLPPSSMEGGDR